MSYVQDLCVLLTTNSLIHQPWRSTLIYLICDVLVPGATFIDIRDVVSSVYERIRIDAAWHKNIVII